MYHAIVLAQVDEESMVAPQQFIKPTGYPLSQFFVDVTWYRNAGQIDEIPTVDFEATVAPEKLVPPMLARFMDTDRGFRRQRAQGR